MGVQDLNDWVGRTTEMADVVTAGPFRAMAATLDREAASDSYEVVPPLWHWLYFLPHERQSMIGDDGHPKKGGFLPPVPFPRRMWAGGRLEFPQPLRLGDTIKRSSSIANIDRKQGRTGDLVFVEVRHEIATAEGVVIIEKQDIVYRNMPEPGETNLPLKKARLDYQFSTEIVPDPILLFRYSALTFNSHRIHYDQSYATQVEGYPGLIVHGPLIATLLIEQLARECPQVRVVTFEFKAVSPLFHTSGFTVCGRIDGQSASLWAIGPQGQLAMFATATLG